jgi:hypothetical protein
MELEEIRSNHPKLFTILNNVLTSPESWSEVHKDLSDLFWFSSSASPDSVIFGLISISDRSGVSLLSGQSSFDIFSLSRAKLFINDAIYKVVTDKSNIKEICTSSKKLINDMIFFKTCLEKLQKAEEESIEDEVRDIERIYKKFKERFVDVTRQLEKSIQHEFDKSFSDVLDEVFFSVVLKPVKDRLRSMELLSLLRSYKKERYFSGTYSYFPSSNKYEDIYIGEMQDDQKHGYGKMYYSFRDLYEGFWKNDKKHGQGVYTWKSGAKYLGEFKSGKFHGMGCKVSSNGSYYKGQFVKGRKHGPGFMKFKNGDTYEGQWFDDDMNGRGVYTWKTGEKFEGDFKKDKREGKGTLILTTGEVIEGQWKDGVQEIQNSPDA